MAEKIEKKDNSFLWLSFLNGDKNALGEIYQNCYDLLFNYGIKICSEQEIVRDCIQSLYIKLYDNKNLKKIAYVEAYLLHSLRNMIYDHHAKDNKKVDFDSSLFDIEINDRQLEKLFEKDDTYLEKTRQVAWAFNQLIPNHKQALYLRYVKELSYSEISIILGIKEQSAMNLVSRALQAIRVKNKKI